MSSKLTGGDAIVIVPFLVVLLVIAWVIRRGLCTPGIVPRVVAAITILGALTVVTYVALQF